MTQSVEFDYVVVGAGSAGCVVARRLADAHHRVLLVETGPDDRSWVIRMPAGLRSIFKPTSKYNYSYVSTLQSTLGNRAIQQPRGRVLGGSSSINGMTWLRGHPLDYDRWDREGAAGWSWANCVPYFKKSEHSDVESPYRGAAGAIHANRNAPLGELDRAFLQAGEEAGFPFTSDTNGYCQGGGGRFEMSVDHGVRNSAAHGYLRFRPADEYLSIWTRATAQRLILREDTVVGVAILRGNAEVNVHATAEVIVCAGAFGSPQLLLLSGLGPERDLRKLGVSVAAPLPGVGGNLQDHLECHIQVETKRAIGLNRELRWHRMLLAGCKWFLFRSGVAASNQCHVGAFLKSSSDVVHPDVQVHFFPVFFDDNWLPTASVNGYRIGVGPVRPASRGRVTLRTANVFDAPVIDPGYLTNDDDWRVMRAAVRLGLKIAHQPALEQLSVREDSPGRDVSRIPDLDDFIRRDASSAYHPCGTCKMGSGTDPLAVVTPELTVKGIGNLRIVDASVMPSLPSANINAATIMIAERASDIILGNRLLPPENLPYAV